MSERKKNMDESESEEEKKERLTWSNSHAVMEALATICEENHKCWDKIAAQVPAKSSQETIQVYHTLLHDVALIESGRVELPYPISSYDSGERSAKNTQEKQLRELVTRNQDEQNATQQSQEMRQDEDATRNNAEADDHAEPIK